MRRFVGWLGCLGICAAVAGAGTPAVWAGTAGGPPAAVPAGPGDPDDPAFSEGLVMTISYGTVVWPVARVVLLQCSPVRGTHPHAKTACAALRPAGGDLERVKGAVGGSCAPSFDPVTISTFGRWDGLPVASLHTYSNRCVLARALGDIANF